MGGAAATEHCGAEGAGLRSWQLASPPPMHARMAAHRPSPLLQFYRPAVAHTVYSLALDYADVYSSQFKVVRLLATSPF